MFGRQGCYLYLRFSLLGDSGLFLSIKQILVKKDYCISKDAFILVGVEMKRTKSLPSRAVGPPCSVRISEGSKRELLRLECREKLMKGMAFGLGLKD